MAYYVKREGELGDLWDLFKAEKNDKKKILYLKCYCIILSNKYRKLELNK